MMRKNILFVCLLAVAMSATGAAASMLSAESAAWADSVMSGLTMRERIAQLFVPRLDITDNDAGFAQLKKAVQTDGMGGILLGKGTVESYAALINRAQQTAKVPLMVTLDGEWGLSMRVGGTPRFPHNMALGAAGDEGLLYAYGREMARQCRLMGIQVNFAPVLDVNSNPANPVIGYRSFGEDPELVGRLGAAYCRGLLEGGVLPVGKHFPGHGDTSTDSHKTLPLVGHTVAQLLNADIRPFVTAIEAGMPSVMVGHLKVPALDPSGTPASLSYPIITELLQNQLGFDGLIFTDALAMKGASREGENNCVSALLAGADVLLGSGSPSADLAAVEKAVASGKVTETLINERCRKMLQYKYMLGLAKKPKPVDAKAAACQLSTAETESLIDNMASKAVTVLRNEGALLPLSGNAKTVVVSIGGTAGDEFLKMIKGRQGVSVFTVPRSGVIPASVLSAVKGADRVVVATGSDSAGAKEAFSELTKCKTAVGVFFMNPYRAAKFGGLAGLKSIVMAFDDIPQLRRAAAKVLTGDAGVSGRMPVNVPGLASEGDGIDL